ncbi:hypothetical protein [Geminocystis sp. NIES-3709]|uniref:hypothetical protein n=1 Tax=Geminocystis sp. NIES-3709 TaxID=1617448 RepID=UPI000826C2BB|nr:hypothetical protein [Geminocystis sp. NIES-3709]
MNEFNAITQFVSALPKIVDALMQCDSIMRQHEEREAMQYSEQEYLQSLYRLYKSHKITADEARKGLKLIFREDTYTIDATAVDSYILKLLK